MKAPEIRFGYGSIISLVAFLSALILDRFYSKKTYKILYFIVILLVFIPISYKNKNNFNNFSNNSFVRNFNYNNFKVLYETNGHKVYRPSDNFCNAFIGFCTHQGFKVTIDKKNNFFFIKKN